MHFILFCKYYNDLRKHFQRPLFKAGEDFYYQKAFKYLCALDNLDVCHSVSTFIVSAFFKKNVFKEILIFGNINI